MFFCFFFYQATSKERLQFGRGFVTPLAPRLRKLHAAAIGARGDWEREAFSRWRSILFCQDRNSSPPFTRSPIRPSLYYRPSRARLLNEYTRSQVQSLRPSRPFETQSSSKKIFLVKYNFKESLKRYNFLIKKKFKAAYISDFRIMLNFFEKQ